MSEVPIVFAKCVWSVMGNTDNIENYVLAVADCCKWTETIESTRSILARIYFII